MRNAPSDLLQSADRTLALVAAVRDSGDEGLRVTEAAQLIGVTPSTAFRYLRVAEHRGFVVKNEKRRYLPGPALWARVVTGGGPLKLFRLRLLPHMEQLCADVNETVNLLVRVDIATRFLCSVECRQAVRVGDRQGMIYPAHQTSGGKALLADLNDAELRALYRIGDGDVAGPGGSSAPPRDSSRNLSSAYGLAPTQFTRLIQEVREVRFKGYAVNRGTTEQGLCAVGMKVVLPDIEVVGAISIAAPSFRMPESRIPEMAHVLRESIARASSPDRRLSLRDSLPGEGRIDGRK